MSQNAKLIPLQLVDKCDKIPLIMEKVNMKNYYITTAIAYASGKPHIGNTYEIILSDSIARFKRNQGYNVFFQTGTDEHGQKVEEKAGAKGVTPKAFVDDVSGEIKRLWDSANISYDKFIRTTDIDHEKQVQKIFKKLYDQGDIYKGAYEGNYCTPCESFWTESQLVDGKCPDCGREVKKAKEEAYFFKMSKYSDRLLKYYEENPNFIVPISRKNEMINNFIKVGLQDLCVSRKSIKWGIPVDFDPSHTVYVWLDALTNYITGLGFDLSGNNDPKYNEFWPADVHVVGKDIVRFHVIYWPIFLMALGLPLPKQVYGHGWLLQNGEKMSKSKGNVIYFDDLKDVFGQDPARYYVLSEMGYEDDGLIGWDLVTDKVNTDLANIYGNLVSRTIAMSKKYFGGVVENKNVAEDVDNDLKEVVTSAYDKVAKKMDEFKVSDAISEVFQIFKRANKYIDETMPWALAKDESKSGRLATVLYNLVESIVVGTSLLQPYMPSTADKVLTALGTTLRSYDQLNKFGLYEKTTINGDFPVLFPRLDVKEVLAKSEIIKQNQLKEYNKMMAEENAKKVELIDITDFEKVKIKVGEILNSERIEKSDKLLKNTIKIGDEVRTIVSGIAKYYTPEEMIGKKVLVVTNLKPIKLRGVESQGMVLCAENGEDLCLTAIEKDLPSGSEVV